MRIVAVQYDVVWEDKAANHELVAGLLASVAVEGDELVVFPEMFDTGFSLDLERTAEEEGGASHQFLADLAQRRGGHVLAGITVRKDDGHVENQAVVFGADGSVVARYAKIHPFSPGGESEVISAGDSVVTFSLGEFLVAPFVCYDLRFPEIYRIATGRGAELLITIANWPGVRAAHWRALLAARAIENQAFVLGVNRCGVDPNHGYAGQSVLFDPLGDVVGCAEESECVLVREIDVEEVVARRREFPVQEDSRPHLYFNHERKGP